MAFISFIIFIISCAVAVAVYGISHMQRGEKYRTSEVTFSMFILTGMLAGGISYFILPPFLDGWEIYAVSAILFGFAISGTARRITYRSEFIQDLVSVTNSLALSCGFALGRAYFF